MTTLRTEIEAGYIDQNGFVRENQTDPYTDNGILYTSQYLIQLKRNGDLQPTDVEHFDQKILSCYAKTGLLNRRPADTSQEGPDDYIGLCSFSKECSDVMADEVNQYGRSTTPHYVYNNFNPGHFSWSAWLGRQVGFAAFIKLCAGDWTNPIEDLCLYTGLIITSLSNKSETSDRVLGQLIIDQLPNYPVSFLIKCWWNWRIKRLYGTFQQVMSVYFGPEHPLTKYYKGA